MKIKSPIGTDPGRTRIDQLMISPSATTGAGETVSRVTTWKVNWTTKSAKFHVFNAQIRSLDSTYDSLSPAIQNEWQLAALAIPDNRGCGCSKHTLDGQTLHRNVNLNLAMRSIAPVLHPPSVTGYLGSRIDIIFNAYSPPWTQPSTQVYFGFPIPSHDWLFLSHLYSGLWCYGPCVGGSPALFLPGDVIYDFCVTFAQETQLRWCTSTDTGLPSQTGIITLGQSR